MLILQQKPEHWIDLRLGGLLLCRIKCELRGTAIMLIFDPHPHVDIVRDDAIQRLPVPRGRQPAQAAAEAPTNE